MYIHSDPFYREDNGNGYSVYERDAICSKCHKIIDRQTQYIGIYDSFKFSSNEKEQYKYCPYCGEKLGGV